MATAPDSATVKGLLRFIEDQSAFSGRVAGSEAERMCQTALAGRLDRIGMEAVVEGAVCPPPLPRILLLHAVWLLLAIVLALFRPGAAAILGGIGKLSFWGELRGRPRILRWLLLKRITQNMVARHRNPEARGKVVLVAHADVASSAALFLPWVKRWTLHRESPGRTLHPGALVLVAGTAQTIAAVEQWSRTDTSLFALTLLLGAAVVHAGLFALAVDWLRSPPVEGAVDNASGLAVLLATSKELVRRPLRNAELWTVATGDREPEAGGMRAFLKQFASHLDPDRTFVINVDEVGRGKLHIVTAEGRWARVSYRPTLPGLAERLAARDGYEVVEAAVVGTTDAGPPTRAGFRAVTLTCLEDGERPDLLHTHDDTSAAIQPEALAEALDFTIALAREVDSFLDPDAGDAGLTSPPGASGP